VGGATASTFTISSLSDGDVVTVIMTSSSSCATGSPATSNSITVTVQSVVAASVSITASPSDTICAGDAVTFTATPTGGGTTPTYQWQVNGVNVGGATSATFTSSSLANGDQVTVIMTSSSSCATGSPATSNTITMTVNPLPVVSATSTTICNGASGTITASGATTYTWSTGDNTASITQSPASTTTYTVTGTTGGCSATATGTITVNTCNAPVANFTADITNFCNSGCVNFTDLSTNTPTSWSWSFPGGSPSSSTLQNPTGICYSATGGYTVILIATNANGSDTLTQVGYITVGIPTPVTISGNTSIDACESTALTASPSDGTYAWGPYVNLDCSNCVTAVVSPTATQDYYVTYTSPAGCTDSDTITVNVINLYNYFMPTGFSPNGDGINDELQVHGRGIDYINLKIFDRLGEKVYETSNIDDAWDGKLHGVAMNNGVFVYMLEVTYCNGETVKEQGNLTLAK
jgi:gliding motility-associated-like protein